MTYSLKIYGLNKKFYTARRAAMFILRATASRHGQSTVEYILDWFAPEGWEGMGTEYDPENPEAMIDVFASNEVNEAFINNGKTPKKRAEVEDEIAEIASEVLKNKGFKLLHLSTLQKTHINEYMEKLFIECNEEDEGELEEIMCAIDRIFECGPNQNWITSKNAINIFKFLSACKNHIGTQDKTFNSLNRQIWDMILQ